MNQANIGAYIAKKRKEKNLTQEQLTLAELIAGEDAAENSVRVYDDAQLLDLLRRTQELEKSKNVLSGVILIVLGIACYAISGGIGGSPAKDFVSGLLLGISVAEMLAGIIVAMKNLSKK